MPRGCVAEGVRVRVARGARPSFRRRRAAKWGCAEGARVQRKTVCRGADGKQVGARGAHVHLMTDVARARTSSACPPPPPGRKNLDVGVVRSGSHHSADSTHRLALHARPFCATPLRCSTPPKRQTSTASNPDAHALCYTPTGHALLSAARRFVRSTQNIRSDSRGQSPNALAAHFQSAALHAAC